MTAMELLEAIGGIHPEYILEAREDTAGQAHGKPRVFRAAAVAALVLAGLLFVRTPLGVKAVEIVKQQICDIIETLFPPRDLIVTPEGEAQAVPHEAQGREPTEGAAGFAIYVDPSRYAMTQAEGVTYIRPLTWEDTLPVTEIEIREIPDQAPQDYSLACLAEIEGDWEVIREIHWIDKPLGYTFSLFAGTSWDSAQEVHYFLDNGQGGCFHLISRFFLEATEGHGTRFAAMIQTFSLITPGETATAPASDAPSPEPMVSAFLNAYFSGDREAAGACLAGTYSGDGALYTDFAGGEPVIHAIKGLDRAYQDRVSVSVEFLATADSDSYTYLSMELILEQGQWKISEYGLEG